MSRALWAGLCTPWSLVEDMRPEMHKKLMAAVTDIYANKPKVLGRCQQEFINRHVCICTGLLIHPSLSTYFYITLLSLVIQRDGL